MKASELITLLQDAIDKYGDLSLENDDTIAEAADLVVELSPLDSYSRLAYITGNKAEAFFVDLLTTT